MRARHAKRACVVAVLVALGIVAGGCGDDDAKGSIPTTTELEDAAAVLRWPTAAPGGEALERFAKPSALVNPSAEEIAQRANICTWYSHWIAVTRGEATGDRAAIETYLADVIPGFEWVMSANGTQWAQGVATDAAAGDDAQLLRFLDENDCELLT